MIVLVKTLQVILALAVLILFHELGHFTFAKLFGIRVDKFFLFFDVNGFKLLSTKEGWFSKLFPGLKKYETEYGIGWLPFGGYCKINGMVDESMDTDFLQHEPQPWEFRSKPAWQRLLVMSGGVLFNFILAIFFFIIILGVWGETYLSNEDNAIYVNELSYDMGFRTGDRILLLDDYAPENFSMLAADIVRRQVRKVILLRGADTVSVYIDQARTGDILQHPDMFSVAVPFVVDSIPQISPNYEAGFRHGDRFIAVNGRPLTYVQESHEAVEGLRDQAVPVTVVRGADTLAMDMRLDTLGRALIYAQIPGIRTRRYNALTAIPAGFRMAWTSVSDYLKDLRMVATPSTGAYKSVGSFIAIGQAFPGYWDWYRFLYLLAILSIMLGVMNLLPIPALDGGHIVFTLYEMITGRKPGEKFLMVAQMIGLVLIFGLMFLACGNDLMRLLRP
ncbi:MAG: RIP metalloprotease RseP [Bacteroidales bacterium]|nr:RIP metalloprotease RseP [Bacteroidales bacterium]